MLVNGFLGLENSGVKPTLCSGDWPRSCVLPPIFILGARKKDRQISSNFDVKHRGHFGRVNDPVGISFLSPQVEKI